MGKSVRRIETLLLFIYLIGVLFYSFFISLFSIPVHLGVDEELYISMAKSIHYNGYFIHNGQSANYSCILYSVLISVAYFFYTPEHIMLLFRMIGVLCMVSSVFPVFFLGTAILKDQKKACILAGLTLILPSMMDVAYCMQEVLAYPLFLWFVYHVYMEISEGHILQINRRMFMILLLTLACYYTKTYFIYLPFFYCMFIAKEAISEARRRHDISMLTGSTVKIVFYLILFGAVYASGKYGVEYIAAGRGTQANHYATQFASLFPIEAKTVVSAVSCMIFYAIALLCYWGILPVLLPGVFYKKYEKKDALFSEFIFGGIVFLMAEIVITVVLTEERMPYLPHKFLYRYFQIYEVPVFMLYIKYAEKFRIPLKSVVIASFSYLYMAGYCMILGTKGRTSIIDAPFFLLIENATKNIWKYSGITAGILCWGLFAFMGMIFYRKTLRNELHAYKIALVGILVCFFVINTVQLPYYTNIIADGSNIESDAYALAEYCNSELKEGKTIYYIQSDTDRYEQAVYAYLKQNVMELTEYPSDHEENTIIIEAAKNESMPGSSWHRILPALKTIKVYQ